MLLLAFASAPAVAQVVEEEAVPPDAPRYGKPETVRFRVGAEITASRGACRNIVAMVTVPLDCPEQQVEIVDEDISPDVEVTFRFLPGGEVKQMLISVPYLARGASAHAILTTEVTTRPVLPPEKTDGLKIPKKVPSKIRIFTNGSPYIEVKHQRIRSLSRDVLEDLDEKATDWERVETIYDWVLENIDYVDGEDKGAIDTLRDGHADCQGRAAVFVALCRANKIPARMVWVDGHVYPEFYLESSEPAPEPEADAKTRRRSKDPPGYWFPAESAGSRSFGEMPLARTILQKGDNFRVPERKSERLRYATDFMIGLPTSSGGGQPKVKFIREQLL